MKLTAFLLTVAFLQVHAKGISQVTLSLREAPVEKVFREIERQTGYGFLYTKEMLADLPQVTINVRNASIKEVLNQCFKGQSLEYSIDNNTIVITRKVFAAAKILVPAPVPSLPPPIEIHGRVVNQQGEPLQNVSVLISGTKVGTTTNSEGRFTLTAPDDKNIVIEVSSVGYQTKRVDVGKQTEVNVTLELDVSGLSDVVVVGYGTVKKKDLTGSISQIKPKEFNAFPTGNILQALSGRATGVQVLQKDGTPGATPSIRIRGTNSILGSNEPLYVIDGFPGSSTNVQATDIESIEILKDASATAIYGSRGANGVVIITTKKGKQGEPRVDYEGSYGIQSATKKLDLMNGIEWAKFYNEQAKNDGLPIRFSESKLDSIINIPNTDWQDLVLRRSPVSHHSLTVSGGNKNTIFSISGDVFLQDGIIKNSNFNRYSIRANVNHEISKIFNLSFNTLLTKTKTSSKTTTGTRGNGLIGAMLGAPPILSPYNSDGTLRRLNTVYNWLSNVLVNPLVFINEQIHKTDGDRQLVNVAFDIKPLNDVVIRLAGGIQNENSWTNNFDQVDPIINSTGSAIVGGSKNMSLLSENTITYSRTFGGHSVSALGGFSYQDGLSTGLSASGTGFLSNVVETYNLQGATSQGIASSSYSKSVLLSYFARVNYNYKGKYFASLSYRRDGSSKFSILNKWSDFPSGAIAWRVSEEKFMQPLLFISNLKIRGSYGLTGNNALNPYQTLNALQAGKVVFNDALFTTYGPGITKPGQLKWETTYEYDAGVDLDLFSGKVNITIDYYHKNTKDLLNAVQLPASSGYSNTVQNVGKIQNRGWEFATNVQILDKVIRWDVNANISFNRNKVIKLYNGQDIFGAVFNTGPLTDFINLLREKQPFGVFYGYMEDGYTSTGNIKYKDFNNDGNINSEDKVIIGNPNPKFTYGFNSSISFKRFDLVLFLQGVQGNDIFNLDANTNIDLGFGLNVPIDVYNNHWTPEKLNVKYPLVSSKIKGNVSNRFVEDGSYLRLKNIQLSYNLPLSQKWIKGLQIYLSGQNLITITKFSWFDPEINSLGSGNSMNQGLNYFGYPTAKTITAGVRCAF